MKLITSITLSVLLMFTLASNVYADPTNARKADKNPNIVSYYKEGTHGIVLEYTDHTGSDLVMRAGKSGNFHQWFLGYSSEEGYHGVHTLWLVLKGDKCPSTFTLVKSPNPDWGSHFPEDTDYCVKNNLFFLKNRNK